MTPYRMLSQYPKYKFILAFCDLALLISAWFAAILLRFSATPVAELINHPRFFHQLAFIAIYSVAWIFIFQHFHLYKLNVFLSVREHISAIAKVMFTGSVGMILLSFFLKGMDWIDSRSVLIYFIGLALLSLISFRIFVFRPAFKAASKRKFIRQRVLVIGTDCTAETLGAAISADPHHRFELIDTISNYTDSYFGREDDDPLEVRSSEIEDLVIKENIAEVIITDGGTDHDRLLKLVDRVRQTKATIRLASGLYDIVSEKMILEKYVGIPVVMISKNQDSFLFSVYKRVFDIFATLIALTILSIPLLVIAAMIRLSSTGPALFKQIRIGRNGVPFTFYKFRTMRVGNDDAAHREYVSSFISERGAGGETKKMKDDPRVTPLGRFLRKTSLDEMPQLLNVIRGDMSLVGPRPCLPYELELYKEWHRRRLSVTPGCTGLWQTSGRSSVDFNDMVILDLFYIDNMSPIFDLKIIANTVPVMLFAKGGH